MNYESKEPFPVPNGGKCSPAVFTFAAQQMGSRILYRARLSAGAAVGSCPDVYRRAIYMTDGANPCSEHDDAGRGGGIPRIRHDARWYIFGQMGARPDCPCHQ